MSRSFVQKGILLFTGVAALSPSGDTSGVARGFIHAASTVGVSASPFMLQRKSCSVNPHAMQNNGELSGDCHSGDVIAASLGNLHAPGTQSRPFLRVIQKDCGRLDQMSARHATAELRDAKVTIHLARLILLRRQAKYPPTSSDLRKRCGVSIAVTKDSAMIGPTPGAVISLRHTGCSFAMRLIFLVTFSSSSSTAW